MDTYKFKRLIKEHSKEIEKGLLERKSISDIEEQSSKIDLF